MFAKLFDTPNGQLLVTHEYDDDEHPDAPFRLVFRGEQHQGVDPSMALGWWTESERDEAFANVDQNRADETAASLSSALRSFMDTGDPA